MKSILIFVAAAFATLALSQCNTMSGLGEDVQDAGTSIQRAAR